MNARKIIEAGPGPDIKKEDFGAPRPLMMDGRPVPGIMFAPAIDSEHVEETEEESSLEFFRRVMGE